MRSVVADCRHALRVYARAPGPTLIAVAGFAVAIAAVAAFVSLYVDLILRPHGGFEQSDRIVTFGWSDGRSSGGLPRELIERIADEAATLEAAAGAAGMSFEVGPDRETLLGEMVTREFFNGVRPRLALGRGFEPAEHQADGAPVVVISHAYWQQLGGRDDVIGRTIELDGRGGTKGGPPEPQGPTHFRIVGVMDAHLTGTSSLGAQTMFWIPVERALALLGSDVSAMNAVLRMRGIGRRSPDASAAAIANELNQRFDGDIDPLLTSRRGGLRFEVLDGLVFDTLVQRSARAQLELFLGASILLALVAAANLSLFLLARAPGRRRELGIRMSVGAPLKRLVRQLASEAGGLVLSGLALGVAISIWLAEFLRGLPFLRDAQWRDVTLLDWRVLGILGAFAFVLAVLVALAPVLSLKRLGIAGSSKLASAAPSAVQRIAGAAQIAIAATLGGTAVAFAWYLGTLMFEHPGYQTRDMHAASYAVPQYAVALGAAQREFDEGLIADNARRHEAIMSIPGVTNVSLAGMVPGLALAASSEEVPHPSDATRTIHVQSTTVDSHYVDVLGLRLLHGRSPSTADVSGMLVNRALARAFWDRDDVVGESLPWQRLFSDERKEIIGVLADLPYEHPAAEVEPMAFITSGHYLVGGLAIIESTMSSAELRQALQDLVDSGSLELTILEVSTLSALRNQTIADDRARGFLTLGCAALVVLLAGIGFYGTQGYLVAAGRREYAIRASLGAGPSALGRLVLRRGLQLGLPGLIFGLPLAFGSVAWLRDDYVSSRISPGAVTVAVIVGLVSLLIAASVGPAAEARRARPAALLRED